MVEVPPALEPLLEDIDGVSLSRRNSKRGHDIERISHSLVEFGWHAPIVATKDGEVIIGNGRWKASKKLKLEKVPILRVEDSDVKAMGRMIADNRLSELSEWNIDGLQEILDKMGSEPFDKWDMNEIVKDMLDSDIDVDGISLDAPSFGGNDALMQKRVFFEVSLNKEDVPEFRSKMKELEENFPSISIRVTR